MSKDLVKTDIPDSGKGQFLVYEAENGQLKIDVRLADETVWLTQQLMADLFQTTKQNLSLHIQSIFEEGELAPEATVKKYLTVRREGKREVSRLLDYYNLDMIISVGYRVKSHVATRFRIWATQRLREYIVKGFVLDDERLKNPDQPFDYFDELIRRIQDIRTSERRFYQKITDIYATSIDYDPTLEISIEFFKTVQNKMHWAITGMTAAEIVHDRADSDKTNMGLTNWRGAKVRKQDVIIAKNYLTEPELLALNNLVEQYLIFAEGQAMRRIPMHMADWIKKLDAFMTFNEREILTHAGRISHEMAKEMNDLSELVVKRSWSAGAVDDPKPRDLTERLVVVRDGKRVSVQNQEIWQDFIRSMIPPGITQFFFFDGEKIQAIAADDHSEVRLKSSLEAALGIQYINRLAADIIYIKNDERKGFVEISDEDIDFKQSELKKERGKLNRKHQERETVRLELEEFKGRLDDARQRFSAAFHTEPETREAMRENEKKRIQAANRLAQVESEIHSLCEKTLPFAITGRLFDPIRRQIEAERESAGGEAIKEHAAPLSKRIVRVVEEPEPIYRETLSSEKMAELERRIYRLLKEGNPKSDVVKILDLSDRDAARVLNKMETLEGSDVFLLKPLLEEKRELTAYARRLDGLSQTGLLTESERELFEQLQAEMEGCATQIGRKTEQLRLLEEEILLLQGGQSLPINPFVLPAYDEQTVNVSAREKAESFASINSKLGVVQKGALTEAIRAAYARRADTAAPYPDFHDVYQIVSTMYEEDNKRDDSLIEVLRDLSDFDLFWRHGSDIPPIDRLSGRTILIDVHAMPVLKELVAYLVIERLYKEMAQLPDSPVKDGHRTLRTILVIDEAHNYLGQKNIFLQRIIREGRSKGIVVFFASQSPNDYQQKFFNFQELLEFAFVFQCEGVAAGSVQDILGCGAKTARDLQTEIARLEPWQVIARSSEKTEEFVKFTVEAFYKSY